MTIAEYSDFGYLRVAVASPELRVGDPGFNAARTIEMLGELAAQGCSIAVFPELGLTGYTCADLFFQSALRDGAIRALLEVAEATRLISLAAVVGVPLVEGGRLFNCAAVVASGRVRGIVPKTFLPTSQEYYEERWFARASAFGSGTIRIGSEDVPAGADLLFDMEDRPSCRFGIEICEDLWAVEPPSGAMALAGATLILNPSASDELLGKVEYRRELVRQQSGRCLAAYAYASSGLWESSTDVVFSGHGLLAECGSVLSETERFQFASSSAIADFDLQRITNERLRNSSFSAVSPREFRKVSFSIGQPAIDSISLLRPVPANPFVPGEAGERSIHCREIFAIQSAGLARRLAHSKAAKAVIGLSGGLDSTLAALVCVHALSRLGRSPQDLLTVIMPGPGSTRRTQDNAARLAEALGAEARTIRIGPAVDLHLSDIGHPADLHDATYENAQARERTQILMDIANQTGGIVVGTGDLSEMALGWCTYNGDQMSMYHVNSGVPKTLVKYLVQWCADEVFDEPARSLLLDIIATPISPELLPLDGAAELVQKTEETVGPYELHDFFLFQVVRNGFPPTKILTLAEIAFHERYDRDVLVRWLEVFYTRFFAHQFKRSAIPDGPKVGTVALSPRGDWRMPSDASAAEWLAQVARLRDAKKQEISQ